MKLVFAGGGTGGHLYPALAIAQSWKESHPSDEILFVGTPRGIENTVVPKYGFPLYLLPVEGIPRKVSWETLKKLFLVPKSLINAFIFLKKEKPDIVVGTGGYASFPVVFAATVLKIPTVIHEQNAYPGIANKILAARVDAVCLTFGEAKKRMKAKKLYETGLPVRREFFTNAAKRNELRKKMGVGKDELLLVAFGGSQGALTINKVVGYLLPEIMLRPNLRLVWATGPRNYENLKQKYKNLPERVQMVPYIDNMPEVLPAADLAITRAGAATLAEIAASKVPAVLIPYPYAAENHQEHNARAFVSHGAAVLLRDAECSEDRVKATILPLLDSPEKLVKMAENAGKVLRRDSLKEITGIMEALLKPKSNKKT
ncbi:undecaprenyldiphospho-muramoylpentapeptide beta-N-acetylglucosaminyltransferase [Carboxydothermus ferrireducens]|uniref:UDP-N-acetylglucosamine--N-acetylmuramyl-(pentapeptide) pyrophosphoryl-undecaprenol N-acetylglucosamine transferase n=1 Tax=Carboxydothermus ferrireducens DSM 11255 TaxID=1119529 RepID=A0ABX2RC96_9THEO|nr:undecaprenyldiphospho-muramoylpentapeptide beta-N-acetylglucosaminyltransferase [Carboxydothermus ferrireducens]NYE58784.1 UDP-N-acetylglucosamine--N-acetylmuramyl-(pentapeptide) pyrophosphoryl-undecaprenol N-acetylglucosamine transferase [Carboxydothermus ferrireducens DSM 11255]